MATYYARKTGNINATDVWATTPSGTAAAVTFASGDVLVANSFTITVNVSTDLGGTGQLRNDTTGGATGGGGFTLSDGITLTANIFGGTTASTSCVTANPTTNIYIVGNITGGNAGLAWGLNNSSGTGTINVTGNVTAGSSSVNATLGILLGTATLLVTGNVNGGASGAGTQGEGIRFSGAGSCTVTGNVTGGGTVSAYAIRATATGNITVIGKAQGGVAAPAINNESTGQVTVTRAVGNGFGGGSVGLSAAFGVSNVATQSSITIVEEMEFGTLGQSPVNGRIRLKKLSTNVAIFNFCDTAGAKTLIDATANAAMPAATDVRSGVSYASGALTGSCAVPAAESTALGVPVGAGFGTAVLTPEAVWGAATRTLTIASGPTAADNATAVWAAASRTITGGTVDTLTNAPSVPSASAIASQVRTELSVELGRVDQNISSRLAATDYTAPSAAPTVVAIRQEMDSNSTKLANLDASVSSRLASASYTAPTTPPTAAQIATAVEGSLLNEADGQAVLNALVSAIGNTNLSEVSLVAAVRADLERNGGKLDNIPTSSAPSASAVAGAVRTELGVELGRLDASVSSRLSPSGTLATVTNLTNAPASVTPSDIWSHAARTLTSASGPTAAEIRQEIDANSTKLDAAISSRMAASEASKLDSIKGKTDLLNTDRLANVATTNIVGTLLAQANS